MNESRLGEPELMTALNNASIAGISRSGKATSAFMTARSNALRDWTEMESSAWDAYQRARAQMLQQPPAGERQAGAPELDVSNLLVAQLAGEARNVLRPKATLLPSSGTGQAGEVYTVRIEFGPPNGEIVDTNITGEKQAFFTFQKGVKLNAQGQGQIQITVVAGGLGPTVDLGKRFPLDYPVNTPGWDCRVILRAADGTPTKFAYFQIKKK